MAIWQTILLAVGGNAALLAVVGWLGKSLFETIIARDTKQFEMDLKAKADIAIETLKSDLELKAIEHQVRFSKLHERRAEVIAELYGYLVEALWAAESFLSPIEWAGEPKKEEKHVSAMNKLVDLYRYFDKNRIYLPPEICASLEKLVTDVRGHVIHFGVYVERNYGNADHVAKEKNAAWDEGWRAIQDQVPNARTALEAQLRALLGNPIPPAAG